MNAVAAPAVVNVRRVIDAPQQVLFDAWLDPASLSQWLRPFATSHTDGASLVTVTLTPQGKGTEVHVLHEKLPANKIEAHNGGWSSGLEKLDAFATRSESP